MYHALFCWGRSLLQMTHLLHPRRATRFKYIISDNILVKSVSYLHIWRSTGKSHMEESFDPSPREPLGSPRRHQSVFIKVIYGNFGIYLWNYPNLWIHHQRLLLFYMPHIVVRCIFNRQNGLVGSTSKQYAGRDHIGPSAHGTVLLRSWTRTWTWT